GVIVECGRYAEKLARGVGGFASRGRQGRDLEVIYERPQRGNVRLRRPAALRIGADDADTNPLGSTLAHHDQATTFMPSRVRISAASASTASARFARIPSSVSSPSSKRV